MGKAKKITVEVPEELLKNALSQTNSGITETVRQALAILAAQSAYESLSEMRGKLKLTDWKDLKKDRE